MIRVAILTVSDGCAAGTREDVSGAKLAEAARDLGWTVVATRIVPDEIGGILLALEDLSGADVVLTTGGTGVAPRDVTPEATRQFSAREVPGLAELMRAEGRKSTKFAPLSRGIAVTRGSTLVVNLPGSPRGALESLQAVSELVPHVVDLLHGRTEHSRKPST
ncbi:MAG TPA: MogA/MoaB family molybdenum cofactor biosynthesis protein [Bryobacteraceae bacterium]|jgi:molybdopterin adenylyltransferase|nr:MogA/MoaB family molybdenum cofactor biosynthesis protein [Bryobacteraceae bacterium]